MADLSKLSDEQLAVYRDMLAKKQQPQHQTSMDKMISNIPSSAYRAVTSPYGEGAPATSQENYKPGEYPPQFSDYVPKIKKFMEHPIDNTISAVKNKFIDDPVGSSLAVAAVGRNAAPETGGAIDAAVSGGTRAAVQQVRPVLSKWSPFMHPLKLLPDLYDAGKNIRQGASQALDEYHGKSSPFDLGPKEARMPTSGGSPFDPKPTGIEGTVTDYKPSNIDDLPVPGKPNTKLGKRFLQSTPFKAEQPLSVTPKQVGKTVPDTPLTPGMDESDIPGGQDKNAASRLGKQLLKKTKSLGSDTGGEFQGHPNAWRRGLQELAGGAPETRPVQPNGVPRTYPPETPTNAPDSFSSSDRVSRPVKRNIIMDEHGEPVMYEDPNEPYKGPGTIKSIIDRRGASGGEGMIPGTEAPDVNMTQSRPVQRYNAMDKPYEDMKKLESEDIHSQIAKEGLDKRAQDSRAKYEDVYQNVIKGNYTPDELRNMGPEEKTALDLKIKNLKHPEDHPNAGKKKYGSGLNPLVTESLAKRLEAETQ